MDKKKLKKLLKNKKFIVIAVLVLVFIICLILLKVLLFPSNNTSKYGNRLDGIEDIKFSKSDKDKVVNSIKENEKVSSAKMNVHGRIVNVIFNVNKDTSIDDAKAIANESLGNFSDEVKGYYDIEYIITMTDEEGVKQEVTNEEGKTEEVVTKSFPIMGYKNTKTNELIW